jgi:hypothetical protein
MNAFAVSGLKNVLKEIVMEDHVQTYFTHLFHSLLLSLCLNHGTP